VGGASPMATRRRTLFSPNDCGALIEIKQSSSGGEGGFFHS